MLGFHFPRSNRAFRVLGLVALLVGGLVGLVTVAPSPAAAYPTANVEVDGHGFGHGRGMGQYGALGYATEPDLQRDYGAILGHFYGNTSMGDIGNPEITVILRKFDVRDTVVIQERGHLVTNAAGGTFSALRARRTGINTFAVDRGDGCGGPWTEINSGIAGPVVFAPQHRNEDRAEMVQVCEPSGATRWLRGEIRAVEGLDNTSRTVNALDMQGYLKGVVPRESPASWADRAGGAGINALKAQAVAARSYAQASDLAHYAKTCDTTACQVYGGRAFQDGSGFFDLEDPRSNRAVDETHGQVRVFDGGGVARTEYSSSTGGYTLPGAFPAVPDEGDRISPFHNWHVSIPAGDVGSRYGVGDLNAVRITERYGFGDWGGHARTVLIEGSGGSRQVSGSSFQFEFGLRSDWFNVGAPSAPPVGPGEPILAGHSGKALDVTAVSQANGAPVQQWSSHGGANQRWAAEALGDGSYRIVAAHSGKVLDVTGVSRADGARIQQWTWLGGANQRWLLENLGDGSYKITSVHSGKVLDVAGPSQADGAAVHQWSWHGGPSQRWRGIFVLNGPPPGPGAPVVAVHSGKALDVASASQNNGAPVQQWSTHGGANQRWAAEALGDGSYRIIAAHSGKVLDVTGVSQADGARIQQWTWLGGANQRWRIEALGDGSYRITSMHSGKVLDVAGPSQADGAAVHQWSWHGGPSQRWRLQVG